MTIIKEARTRAGLTQAQLATRLGTSQPAVARLEAVGANLRLSTLRRAVNATGHELRLEIAAPEIDATLIQEDLALTPAQRVQGARTLAAAGEKLARSRTG